MLSFYEFDCILRKRKNNLKNEALFGNSKDRLKNLAQKLNPPKPIPQAVTPEIGDEPDGLEAAPQKPVSLHPPQIPANPTVGVGAGRKGQLAGRKIQGGGAVEKPTIINPDRDRFDPENPETQRVKAGEEVFGRRLSKGHNKSGGMSDTSATDRASRQAANLQKSLDYFNAMAGGRLEGNQKVGFKRVSDWAAHFNWVLANEFGIQPKDAETGQPIAMGEPFQFVFEPGAAKDKGLPEFVVPGGPKFFAKFVRKFWKTFGMERGANDPNADKKRSVIGLMLPMWQEAEKKGDTSTKAIIKRAIRFFSLLNNAAVAGRNYTVKKLAFKLGQVAGPDRDLNIDDEMARRAMDEEAATLIVKKARQVGYDFLKSQGPSITPDTIVTVVPIDVGISGDQELTGHTSVNTTSPTADDDLTSRDRVKQWLRSQKQASQPSGEDYGDEPPMESTQTNQWMDLTDMMEHWQF